MKELPFINETNHPAKLLLIRFVAARLKARGIGSSEPRQVGQESNSSPSSSLSEVDTNSPVHPCCSNVLARISSDFQIGLESNNPFLQDVWDDPDKLDPRREKVHDNRFNRPSVIVSFVHDL